MCLPVDHFCDCLTMGLSWCKLPIRMLGNNLVKFGPARKIGYCAHHLHAERTGWGEHRGGGGGKGRDSTSGTSRL